MVMMEDILTDNNLEYMCHGYDHADETFNYKCLVYLQPPSCYVRQQCCPFNMPRAIPKRDGRVRVGQQKQKKKR